MDEVEEHDPEAGMGEHGCCPSCGKPFLPGVSHVTSAAYGLCDPTMPNCVRGGKWFMGRCLLCDTLLISEEFTGKEWQDLDSRLVRWRRNPWPQFA